MGFQLGFHEFLYDKDWKGGNNGGLNLIPIWIHSSRKSIASNQSQTIVQFDIPHLLSYSLGGHKRMLFSVNPIGLWFRDDHGRFYLVDLSSSYVENPFQWPEEAWSSMQGPLQHPMSFLQPAYSNGHEDLQRLGWHCEESNILLCRSGLGVL